MQRLTDPEKNLAMDVHEYLDEDFSGGHQACTQPGPANLKDLTDFLKKYELKVRCISPHLCLPNRTHTADRR
jgi:endoglucanase